MSNVVRENVGRAVDCQLIRWDQPDWKMGRVFHPQLYLFHSLKYFVLFSGLFVSVGPPILIGLAGWAPSYCDELPGFFRIFLLENKS